MYKFDAIACNGGRFISRGKGKHQTRIIDSHEIIFVIKGKLTMFEEDDIFELHAGDYLLLRQGRRHGGVAEYPEGLSFFWLHFTDPQNNTLILPSSGKAANAELLAIYFQSFLIEQQRRDSDTLCKNLLLELILQELSRSISSSGNQPLPQLVRQAEEIIKLQFSDPQLSLHYAAKQLHCNTAYLGKIFHHHFHETFSVMLNRIRVEHAAALLLDSHLSVKEIIAESGFNDPAYFRRMFLRRYAATPTAFRKFNTSGHLNTG